MPRRKHPKSLVEEVLSDVRGEIHKLALAGARFNVLFSKGFAIRSGDWHICRQFDLVISGEVEIQYGQYEKSKFKTLLPGELFVIPARVPHLFRFQRDTVLLEWWDGPFKAWYYKPYRQEVEKCLRRGDKFDKLPGTRELIRGDLREGDGGG